MGYELLRSTSRRRCFIHIGTHKTGTTSLQDTLTRNAGLLADAGILVAQTGRPIELAGSPFIGNQNLAWQLIADRRFDPAYGTLAVLERELSQSPCADAIVTSEDFVLAYDRPEQLDSLRDTCLQAGYVPKIVVYLRDQARYAQSLYAMFVVRGKLPISFDRFCDHIFSLGQIGWADCRFPFDYNEFLDPFARCFGEDNLVTRAYCSGPARSSIARDFVSLLGISPALEAGDLIAETRLNEAGTLIEVMGALHESVSATHDDLVHPLQIAKEVGLSEDLLHDRYAAIGPREAERFKIRFAEANAAIATRFGVELERQNIDDSTERRLQRDFLRACTQAWRLANAA